MKKIEEHPVLDIPDVELVEVVVDGKRISARKGEPIASALISNGISVLRTTSRRKEPRSIFCGIGQCNDCVMEVNGIPNVRTCVTPVEEGMVINTQNGLGKLGELDDEN